MSSVRLVQTPCLKPGVLVDVSSAHLRIVNGPFEIGIDLEAPPPPAAIAVLRDRPAESAVFREALGAVLDADDASVDETIVALVHAGVVVEHPARPRDHVPGEYLGWRLIDRFRMRMATTESELALVMETPGHRDVAIGYLLESYFHMRGARQMAVAVLSRTLTARQRALVEEFYLEERTHAETVVEGFALVGLDPDEVRRAVQGPETQLLEDFYFACGHRSLPDFAAALITPEVPVVPPGALHLDAGPSWLDLAETVQGLPAGLLDGFRRHAVVNDELGHGALSVELLAEAGAFTPAQAARLAVTVDDAIDASLTFKAGVLRRYRGWDGRLRMLPDAV